MICTNCGHPRATQQDKEELLSNKIPVFAMWSQLLGVDVCPIEDVKHVSTAASLFAGMRPMCWHPSDETCAFESTLEFT